MDFCTSCRSRVPAATVAWEATAVPGAMPGFLALAARGAMAVPGGMVAHLVPGVRVAMAPFLVTGALAARVEKASAALEATAARVGMRLALVGPAVPEARAETMASAALEATAVRAETQSAQGPAAPEARAETKASPALEATAVPEETRSALGGPAAL